MNKRKSEIIYFIHVAIISFITGNLMACSDWSISPEVVSLNHTININNTWQEIIPKPALTACKKVQYISIKVPHIEKWDINSKSSLFIMPDGKKLKIEINLFDAKGKIYALSEPNLGAGGIGLSYLSKELKAINKGEIGLPKDVSFIKIQLRSSQPFSGGEVSWRCIENY